MFCQLGIGEHVDHRIVRAAAEMLGRPLIYIADLPYSFNHPDELEPMTASLQRSALQVSAAGLEAWLRAIDAYQSQLSSVYESVDALRARVREYASQSAGVPIWSALPIA